jgi:hypothetical protein
MICFQIYYDKDVIKIKTYNIGEQSTLSSLSSYRTEKIGWNHYTNKYRMSKKLYMMINYCYILEIQ